MHPVTTVNRITRIERPAVRLSIVRSTPVAAVVTERTVECAECAGSGVAPLDSFGSRCPVCLGVQVITLRAVAVADEWAVIQADPRGLYSVGCRIGVAPREEDAFRGPGWWSWSAPCDPYDPRHVELLAAVGCSL